MTQVIDVKCLDCGRAAIAEIDENLITITCDHCEATFDFERRGGF